MQKILVVEDEKAVLDNITEILKFEGYSIIGITDSRQTVSNALEYSPDLIVCDILMPELDGYEVLAEMKKNPATAPIPFIFLTAKSSEEDIKYGMNLGVDDYITKPFTPEILLKSVKARLDKQEKIVQIFESRMNKIPQERLNSIFNSGAVVHYTCPVGAGKRGYEWGYEFSFIANSIVNVLGYHPKVFIERPELWRQSIHPDDQETITSGMERLFKRGYTTFDFRLKHKNGTYSWLQDSKQLIRYKDSDKEEIVGCWVDVSGRRKREVLLKESEEKLQGKVNNLEEVNNALRVLLKNREVDRDELEEKIIANVRELILPHFQKMRTTTLDFKQIACLDIIESNLQDIISPFSKKLTVQHMNLTPKELQIASLIKAGKTNREMAAFLNVSVGTVEFHRENIRTKLNLKNKKANLRSYLLSLA